MKAKPVCPECGKKFKDGRGLNGHLRMKHQLRGDDHQEAMSKAMKAAKEKKEKDKERIRNLRKEEVEGMRNPVYEAADRLRKAQGRMEALEELGDIMGMKTEVVKDAKERVKAEVARAKRKLEKAAEEGKDEPSDEDDEKTLLDKAYEELS